MTTPTVEPIVSGSPEIRLGSDAELPALVAALGQERFFADRLDRQRRGLGDLLVAWLDTRPVGDVYLWREPYEQAELRANLTDVPLVQHLEVASQYQRRGIGAALLDEVERLAFSHGYGFACLGVAADNPVRALYDRRGYEDWGHGPVEFRWEEIGDDGKAISHGETCHVLLKGVDPAVPGLDKWDAWHPRDAAALLAECTVPWMVAAGWAIDLHLGRKTRDHSDLEIAIPRSRFSELRQYLAGFKLYDARSGRLRLLGSDQDPDPDSHQIWVCEPAVPAWRMDTFLEPGDAQTWISHRDPRVRVPMRDAVRRTIDGIPYLSPEVVLFTKAKHARDKDDADLANTLATLDAPARLWLGDVIALVHPGHRWLADVRA